MELNSSQPSTGVGLSSELNFAKILLKIIIIVLEDDMAQIILSQFIVVVLNCVIPNSVKLTTKESPDKVNNSQSIG